MTSTAQTHTRRTLAFIATAVLGIAVLGIAAGCSGARRPAPNGVVAANDLVTLSVEGAAESRHFQLTPKPGVKINALLPPVIELPDSTQLIFAAEGRTADSTYFVVPPTVPVGERTSARGRLLASACPEGKRVCLSVALDVDWR